MGQDPDDRRSKKEKVANGGVGYGVDVNLDSHEEEILKATMRGITNGLNAVGLKAVGYASLLCPVDTGLLRNSITYALGGEGAAKKNYSSEEKHASTETTKKHGTAGKTIEAINGKPYEGTAKEVPGKKTVVIGTNVEYAPWANMRPCTEMCIE